MEALLQHHLYFELSSFFLSDAGQEVEAQSKRRNFLLIFDS